jgi:hypothetical protein
MLLCAATLPASALVGTDSQFTPTGSATLAVTNATGRVALPNNDPTIIIQNTGSNAAFFNLGGSTVTATTSNYSLPSGVQIAVTPGTSTYIAAITSSSTTTLNIIQGTGGFPSMAGGGSGGGSGSNASVGTTGSAVPGSGTYVAGSNAGNLQGVAIDNASGGMTVHIDTTQVASTSSPAPIALQSLTTAQDPFTKATLNITTATTTHVVTGTAAQTVRVYRMVLTCAAAQTIDIQSSGGTSLTGGPLTCAASGGIVVDFSGPPWWTSVSAEGIDFVTTTTGAIHGTVYYIKS